MALKRLAKICRCCPLVKTCNTKRMEALGYIDLSNIDEAGLYVIPSEPVVEPATIAVGSREEVIRQLAEASQKAATSSIEMSKALAELTKLAMEYTCLP